MDEAYIPFRCKHFIFNRTAKNIQESVYLTHIKYFGLLSEIGSDKITVAAFDMLPTY